MSVLSDRDYMTCVRPWEQQGLLTRPAPFIVDPSAEAELFQIEVFNKLSMAGGTLPAKRGALRTTDFVQVTIGLSKEMRPDKTGKLLF